MINSIDIMMMIDNKAELEKQKEVRKQKEKELKYNTLCEQIKKWKPRIDELIKVANYAEKNNINFSKSGWGGHEGYDTGMFYTNSWSHLVGFVYNRDGSITSLGINAGGMCGDIDFRTDGDNIWGIKEGSGQIVDPKLCHIERFVNNFDEFEEEFYKYIKKCCKS